MSMIHAIAKKCFVAASLCVVALDCMESEQINWQKLPEEIRELMLGFASQDKNPAQAIRNISTLDEIDSHCDMLLHRYLWKQYVKNYTHHDKQKGILAFLKAVRQCSVRLIEIFLQAGMGADNSLNDLKNVTTEQSKRYPIIIERNCYDTALIEATKQGNSAVVELLIAHNATVDKKDSSGNTALMWAARYGHITIAEQLIKAGANTLLKNDLGMTALLYAGVYGHKTLAKKIMKTQPWWKKSGEIVTKFLRAVMFDDKVKIKQLLQQDMVDDTPIAESLALMYAANNGNIEIVSLLLDHGVAPDAVDNSGVSALGYAARAGHLHVVHRLIRCYRTAVRDYRRSRALVLAAKAGHFKIVNFLLFFNSYEPIALFFAFEHAQEDLIYLLLDQAAPDLNIYDKAGFTPLLYAIAMDNPLRVQQVVERGADVNLSSRNGLKPLEFARHKGNGTIIDVLLSHGAHGDDFDQRSRRHGLLTSVPDYLPDF